MLNNWRRDTSRRKSTRVTLVGAVIALGLGAVPLAQAATTSGQPTQASGSRSESSAELSSGQVTGSSVIVPDRNVVTFPMNHVYIAIHGLPTYTVTTEFLDIAGHRIGDKHVTTFSGKSATYGWQSGSVRVHISGAWNWREATFEASNTSYDHCFLVKSGGDVVDTGDNNSGCHAP